MATQIKWHDDNLKARINAAAVKGIDQIMSTCVIDAKRNHPGWKNRTGTAEGSMRIVKFAEQSGRRVVGRWGSMACLYMIWLELKYGSALRSSADRNYKLLPERIQANLKA